MKNILYLFVAILVFSSCTNTEKSIETDVYSVQMVNKSGVTVEIFSYNTVQEGFPEHLILENDKKFVWYLNKNVEASLPSRMKILWGGYSLEYGGDKKKDDIDPRYFDNYTYINNSDILYQYIFTKEDYQRVVERYEMKDVQNKCIMYNNSGVDVIVEIKILDTRILFPPRIKLSNGSKYEWSFISKELCSKTSFIPSIPVPFGDPSPMTAKIIFNSMFPVEYSMESDRDPRSVTNYVKENVGEDSYVYTYTFTKEDYQNVKNE